MPTLKYFSLNVQGCSQKKASGFVVLIFESICYCLVMTMTQLSGYSCELVNFSLFKLLNKPLLLVYYLNAHILRSLIFFFSQLYYKLLTASNGQCLEQLFPIRQQPATWQSPWHVRTLKTNHTNCFPCSQGKSQNDCPEIGRPFMSNSQGITILVKLFVSSTSIHTTPFYSFLG